MKSFVKRSLFFCLLLVAFIESVSLVLIVTDIFLINYPGSEIYLSIKKSKQKNDSDTLLLGDSVGKQLFSNKTNNEGINSLACNQAIEIVGQFLLLNNYLNAGNKVNKVILLFHPLSFRKNLDQIYTFHYFLKPFYNSEYAPLFSSTVMEQIYIIPYHQFVQIPHILVTSWAPEFNPPGRNDHHFLSPISVEYLKKIKELSIQYNFELSIVPTPTSIEKKELIEQMDLNRISETGLKKEFENYFNEIIYLNSDEFIDGTHLIAPETYSKKYKDDFEN